MTALTWKELTNEEKEWRAKWFADGIKTDLVRFQNGFLLRRLLVDFTNTLRNFNLRDDDIFVMSHPKTGTTWTQELVWMIINNVNVEKSKNTKKIKKSPNIYKITDENHGPEFFERMEGRRVIKTHLTFNFLPSDLCERSKVIYVARNPKDTVVSFYHHLKRKSHFLGDFNEFTKYFKAELVYHSYWPHLMSGWTRRLHPNVKILWYEDMKTDIRSTINELCDFLEHPLTEDQKDVLESHVEFDNMKKNVNAYHNKNYNSAAAEFHFMRKGVVGDWENYFDEKTNKEYDQWIMDKIRGSGMEKLEVLKQILPNLD